MKNTLAFKVDDLTVKRVDDVCARLKVSRSDALRMLVFYGLIDMERGRMIDLERLAGLMEYSQCALFTLLQTLAPDKEERVFRSMEKRIAKFHTKL